MRHSLFLAVLMTASLAVAAPKDCESNLSLNRQIEVAISHIQNRLSVANALGLQFVAPLPQIGRHLADLEKLREALAQGQALSVDTVDLAIAQAFAASVIQADTSLVEVQRPHGVRAREVLRLFGEDEDIR